MSTYNLDAQINAAWLTQVQSNVNVWTLYTQWQREDFESHSYQNWNVYSGLFTFGVHSWQSGQNMFNWIKLKNSNNWFVPSSHFGFAAGHITLSPHIASHLIGGRRIWRFFFITHVILTAHRSKLINILIVFVREQMVCITLCSNLTKQLIILIALFVVKIKKSVHMGWFSVYSIMWAFCSSFRMTERLSADHLIAPSIYKLVPHIYRWFSALKLSVSR